MGYEDMLSFNFRIPHNYSDFLLTLYHINDIMDFSYNLIQDCKV